MCIIPQLPPYTSRTIRCEHQSSFTSPQISTCKSPPAVGQWNRPCRRLRHSAEVRVRFSFGSDAWVNKDAFIEATASQAACAPDSRSSFVALTLQRAHSLTFDPMWQFFDLRCERAAELKSTYSTAITDSLSGYASPIDALSSASSDAVTAKMTRALGRLCQLFGIRRFFVSSNLVIGQYTCVRNRRSPLYN